MGDACGGPRGCKVYIWSLELGRDGGSDGGEGSGDDGGRGRGQGAEARSKGRGRGQGWRGEEGWVCRLACTVDLGKGAGWVLETMGLHLEEGEGVRSGG